MSSSDPAVQAHSSMTESSRTRSDSLDASSSQQDRKRPRLDSGSKNHSQLEGVVADPQILSANPKPDKSNRGTPPTETISPATLSMETSPSASTSKVTINTRTAINEEPLPVDDPIAEVAPTEETQTMSPSPLSKSIESNEEVVGPEIAGDPPEIISIQSSPSRSPEIQIAVVEDIDEDPAETTWSPVTRLHNGMLLDEQPVSCYVSKSFPYSQSTTPGYTHNVLGEVGRVFLASGSRDGEIFIQFKNWLQGFLRVYPCITTQLLNEERVFWEEFPQTVGCLLRRLNDLDTAYRGGSRELEDFFVAYGQLTMRFIEFDLSYLAQSRAPSTDLECRPYLATLAAIFHYHEAPFFAMLHASRGLDVIGLVTSIFERLTLGAHSILPALTIFIDHLGRLLPVRPINSNAFVHCVSIAAGLVRVNCDRRLSLAADHPSLAHIAKFNEKLLEFNIKADDILQNAISKQAPWLTIENSSDILRLMTQTFRSLAEQDLVVARQLRLYVSDLIPDTQEKNLHEVVAHAWKFKIWHKYITSGRMELRVHGIDAMRFDLVEIWRAWVQNNLHCLNVPVVRFLVDFLRANDMVRYIVGVDSHPQIICRSSNVVGFLVVTHTYTDQDSDVIWATVMESQDPRTVNEVLGMLKAIFPMSHLGTLLYLCGKLLKLPIERYDNRIVDYVTSLIHHVLEKTPSQPQHDSGLGVTPFEVFIRVIRDSIASEILPSEQKYHLSQWAADRLTKLLTFPIDEEDKRRLWEQCINDIAQKTVFATGSMRALQAWLDIRPEVEVKRLTTNFDFTRLLIEQLVDYPICLGSNYTSDQMATLSTNTRLNLLLMVAEYVPDKISEELSDKLWFGVLANRSVSSALQSSLWDVFSRTAVRTLIPNSLIDRVMSKYLPRLTADSLNHEILSFAENSVLYEIETGNQRLIDDESVVVLPGINRVWRFVMECPSGTVENEASEWIIKQYLDHDRVVNCLRPVVEATHLSVLDRCLSEVFSAAKKIKSYGTEPENQAASEASESTIDKTVSESEFQVAKLRFTRSLMFLRQFLRGVKSRPRYSPPLAVAPRTPPKPFEQRGKEISITYQVNPPPGRNGQSPQKKLSIGDMNTVDELAKYLSELTGLTEFTGISRGQRMGLFGDETTIKASSVGTGNLLIHKVPNSVEKSPTPARRSNSPMEAHLMDHFDQFYHLLELDEHLSGEVFTFLELFPPQSTITDMVDAQQDRVSELLPIRKPYKLLHGLSALRLRIEDEALGSAPDEDFLTFAVKSLSSVINEFESVNSDKSISLRTNVNQALVDCLLMALRAKVSQATSQAYFSDGQALAKRLVSLTVGAAELSTSDQSKSMVQRMVSQPFAVLMECAIHDPEFRTNLFADTSFIAMLQRNLFEEEKSEIRRAIGDVLLTLAGQPPFKTSMSKPSDPRSPQSRFSTETIKEFLVALWAPLTKTLAETLNFPSRSQQIFEVVIAIVGYAGKQMAQNELVECFQLWAQLLVSYEYREIVGKLREDYIVWGFTNLLHEIFPLIQDLSSDLDTGSIAQSVFEAFLYPASGPTTEASQRIPVLRATTREDLFGLVLSLTRQPEDYDGIIRRLHGLVRDGNFSPVLPSIQCERHSLRSEVGYAGLRNLSNTCYSNSLFSQLFMNLKFREFMFSIDPDVTGVTGQYLLRDMSKLFGAMQNRWDKYVDTADAIGCIETYDNDQIDVSIQMDVDEFFNLLFDRIEGQIASREDKTRFRSLYGGQLVQQIKSRECDHISEKLEPFSAIQCEIKGRNSLEDSLRAYVEGEVMQGDNKYSCTSCNRHVDAVKRSCMKDVPDHLIFNLKRFDFDITTMTRCKVNDEFQFPLSIDMAPYAVETLSNPEKTAKRDMFELVGVLVHSGTAESGHYYSYIRERPSSRAASDSWVQFNDIDVSTFDPEKLADCCFGGIEIGTALHLPKSHNAYMLFYQRVSSIQMFEKTYANHDIDNPVRVPFDEAYALEIDSRNQETILAYCLQDPSHARFMRLMLERMRWREGAHCSFNHTTENIMLRHALDYIHEISSRFKEMPEFFATCALLTGYARSCFKCAHAVAAFFVDSDLAELDPRSCSNVRSAILRNPSVAVRRAFASLMSDALEAMNLAIPDSGTGSEMSFRRESHYRRTYTACMERLSEPWMDLHKYSRAWNDYFELLARLAGFGTWEGGVALDADFLSRSMEIVWIDVRGDPLELRPRWSNYMNLREKGRVFLQTGLLAFIATLLEYIDFNGLAENDSPRVPKNNGLYELTGYELHLLQPRKPHTNKKQILEWFRRMIIARHNSLACEKMVTVLVRERSMIQSLSMTLTQGMGTESVPDAVAFLSPALVFCRDCAITGHVQRVVKDALHGIESISGSSGKEHLDFIIALLNVENEAAGLRGDAFFHMVFSEIASWAPVLLIYPDDIHHDVRGETVAFLETRLFSILLSNPENDVRDVLRGYARALAEGCVEYIKKNHLPAPDKEIPRVDVGQTRQISGVINGTCKYLYSNGSAAEDSFVADATLTLERLNALTLESAETASEEWQDNESIVASESDNGEASECYENP